MYADCIKLYNETLLFLVTAILLFDLNLCVLCECPCVHAIKKTYSLSPCL